MTTEYLEPEPRKRGGVASLEHPRGEPQRSEKVKTIVDAAMTFLLSGDPRLAARATRVIVEERRPASGQSPHPSRTRRVWKRRAR